MATNDKTPGPVARRITELRERQGIKSAKDLAARIPNPAITPVVMQNIESGRKADITIPQMLEIARALEVSPMMLLVDPDRPREPVEVGAESMSLEKFDEWWSSRSPYEWEMPRNYGESLGWKLRELRRWWAMLDELQRLTRRMQLEPEIGPDNPDNPSYRNTRRRIETGLQELQEHVQFLQEHGIQTSLPPGTRVAEPGSGAGNAEPA